MSSFISVYFADNTSKKKLFHKCIKVIILPRVVIIIIYIVCNSFNYHFKIFLGSVITNSLANTIDLKVIQSLIQQFDIVNSFQDTTTSLEEPEDVPPIPEAALNNEELTEEEKEAKKIYETAAAMLAKPRPNKEKAVQLLIESSNKGNQDAKALIAWTKLFGNPLKQDLHVAKEMFAELADLGHHEGHMGLGNLSISIYTNPFSDMFVNSLLTIPLGYFYRVSLCFWTGCQCESSKSSYSLHFCSNWWEYLGKHGIRL